ncbi:alpha-L-fucosidase [Streptomyces fulvoviolaceus]|uniref:alpha-L-fucosidase n=1 Tax=Streptomyces fulvoviolaceus TaxID=285535 RepID=UPI001F2EEA3F|nr:alpha-L-fucosidase [Streptomyces fulvoviolaceus]
MTQTRDTPAATGWMREARFGLFVHFGVYSMAARHEWVRSYEELDDATYQRYVDHFDPDLFDAAAIARTAREAGMRYAVLTTKHHDGFCLWDSALTDYSSARVCGRDLVAEFVTAVRAEGLKVGFYHSLLDWHHPDYVIDGVHPLRNAPDVATLNSGRDMGRYRAYLHAQVKELLTSYGQVDLMFYDFTFPWNRGGMPGKGPEDWDSAELLATTRALQPGIVVNNRLGIPGDYVTPEQYQPDRPLTEDGVEIMWEACQTLNGSWGYHRDNLEFKDPGDLVRMLVQSVSNNGNMILNVGPDGRGNIEPRARAVLRSLAEWMRLHARAVHGAGPAPFTPPAHGVYTLRGNRLYLHLFSWPFRHVHLPGLAGRVEYAQLLNDGSEVEFDVLESTPQPHAHLSPLPQSDGTLTLTLPVTRPDVLLPVVELFLTES